MVFLSGPRQVGKTTAGKRLKALTKHYYYLNWDNQDDREKMIKGPKVIAEEVGLHQVRKEQTLIVFDEIHKYRKWKQFLKGFFDVYGDQCQIIVTGSAKLNVYKAGGDSLMGRYFLYRIHPLTVGEILSPLVGQKEIKAPKKISDKAFQSLYKFGGFPEPYLRKNPRFSVNWQRLRKSQLIREDIRELSQVQEISQLEMLATVLQEQTCQLLNFNSLATMVNVSAPTIKRWLACLESFYFCFKIHPWSKNVKRTLRKEPKYYLWDWSLVKDEGKRKENFIASHLLKAVHLWTDCGFGEYRLHFLRDKEKREVDFIVTKNNEPFFIVEVKSGNHTGISKALYHFQKQIGVKHAFQVVFGEDYVDQNCFKYRKPVIVPAQTFLSQLV
ncbi:MAG: ATP-binding protein [Chlamydiia bacterium]|nr:ATP-binding protein [Chlamydiia bacterium]